MNKYSLWCLALCVLLLSGCGKKFTGINWNFLDRNKLEVQEIDFDYFSTKTKIRFKDNEQDLNTNANVRIKKDSVIWLSVNAALGIEAARGLITKDSMVILNRLEKKLLVYDYDELSEKFGMRIDYNIIQSAFLGNLLVDRDSVDSEDVTRQKDFFFLEQRQDSLRIQNYVSAKTMKVEKVMVVEDNSPNSLVLNYGDFSMLDDHAFPFSGMISLSYNKGSGDLLNLQITIEHNKAVIEEKPLRFPFNVPNKYERL
ncbi:DUF4292 domain-containing protein [Roseivirga sp. BDSF3-8]|uniref:DUF4292 domain-containing protein n=1 Tax=Roseivirga sp. BDSF3-8 TaxID=3241598 RepID=UPI0035320FEA